jgi:hypothetical protein
VEQAASTEVKEPPASEPGAKPRKTAEDRKRELAAEIDDGLKRRAAIREEIAREEARLQSLRNPQQEKREDTPASPPAPAAEKFPSYDAWLEKNADGSYEDYIDERAEFRVEQRWAAKEREAQERAEHEKRAQTVQARDTQFSERLNKAIEAEPDFLEKCSPDVLELRPFEYLTREADGRLRDPQTGKFVLPGRAAVASEVLASDVAPQLMRHFSDHPEELQKLERLHPDALYKAFGALEYRLREGAAKPAPAAPPRKTVTDAPDPGTTLGRRPAAAADEVASAVSRGDFASYEQQANRRDLARYR